MFSGGESIRWIAVWPNYYNTYDDFAAAKGDMLNMLWWLARDYIDADPEYSNAVMSVWSEVAVWDTIFYSSKHHFSTELRGEKYILVRHGKEDEYL